MQSPPVRVLIVDDQRDLLMTAGILLRSEGMEVEMIQNGSDAVATVEAFRPGVVLLDIEMPERSGLQVAMDLKQRFGADCPVLIAFTSHKSDSARRLIARSGFSHHVTKPYDFDVLVSLVRLAGRERAAHG